MHVSTCGRVLEAKDTGMKRLPRKEIETIAYKLLVTRESGSLEDGIATIGDIAEKRMSDMAHVGTDLVCATRLKDTFDKGDIAKTFKNLPMGDSMFPALHLFRKALLMGIDTHHTTVLR